MSLHAHSIISLEEFMIDPLLGNFPEASVPQRLASRLIDALPPANAEQRDLFATLAGRAWGEDLLTRREVLAYLWGVSGGKSLIAGHFLTHRALFCDTSQRRPGQRLVCLLIAPDVKTAQDTTFAYVRGIIEESKLISEELERPPTQDAVEFSRGTSIAILAAALGGRGHRGRRFPAVVIEEGCFWRDQNFAISDSDAVRAALPRLIEGGQLLCISTPWKQSGYMYELHQREFGKSERALVLVAPTEVMRPDFSASRIKSAYEDDPTSASAEYGAQFLEGVSTLFSAADLAEATIEGADYIKPEKEPGWHYVAATDPSGLRNDPWALAVVGRKGDQVRQFVSHSWQPGKPVEALIDELRAMIAPFGLSTVLADQYGSEITRAVVARAGLHMEERTITGAPSSAKTLGFKALKELLIGRRVELLDDPVLQRELRLLEITRLSGGGERIAAPGSGRMHDDRAIALALAVGEIVVGNTADVSEPDWEEDAPLIAERVY